MSKLVLIPSPIGNLEDITIRAIETIKNVDLILCEDTRRTIKLLNHLGIKKKLKSYHKFNEHSLIEKCINDIKAEIQQGLRSFFSYNFGIFFILDVIKQSNGFFLL